jgi:hypothetical protein
MAKAAVPAGQLNDVGSQPLLVVLLPRRNSPQDRPARVTSVTTASSPAQDGAQQLIAAANPREQFRRSDNPHGDDDAGRDDAPASSTICPCCVGRMRIIETFARGAQPRSFMAEPAGIDSL